jgi:hypothetical protein
MLSGSSCNETRKLLSTLAGAAEQTYDAAANAFLGLFPPGERFRGCCAALLLVQVCTPKQQHAFRSVLAADAHEPPMTMLTLQLYCGCRTSSSFPFLSGLQCGTASSVASAMQHLTAIPFCHTWLR